MAQIKNTFTQVPKGLKTFEGFSAFILVLLIIYSSSAYSQKKNTDSPDLTKQTHEEWLQSLPEHTRDSIVYKEWKEAVGEQEKEANQTAKANMDEALTHPDLTSLDLSYYPNTELDPRILTFKKLQRLNLTKAKRLDLVKLFDLLAKFPELHALSLADGNYSALPSNIAKLTDLDSLNFRNSNIKAVPESFTKLQKLRVLNLEHNAYLYDDDLFDKLKQMNVQSLSLSACGLLVLNNKISDVHSLIHLNLSINDIKELPASFAQLTNLTTLDLSQNTSLNLVAISNTLSHLLSLQNLDLDLCYLSSLPAEIGSIKSLHILSLRSNVLTAIPSSIGDLSALVELYISSPKNSFRVNVVKELPVGLGKLSKLRVLDLGGNQLATLSSDFPQLTSLEVLDLSRNMIADFPAAVTTLARLRILDLDMNKISDIPATIGALTSLDSLTLDGDFFNKPLRKIKTLPAEIGNLRNLKKLTLKDNVVEALPESIGSLSQLQILDLRGNLVAELPASFAKLSALRTLDLKSNELKALPNGFTKLPLTDLNIAMNLNIDFRIAIPQIAGMKSLQHLDISYNNITREQAQPLIDGLPDCRIINLDYNKKALPDSAPSEPRENKPQAPGRH
jgi:Leucine-rich repeat (LRR) protein